MGSTDRDNVRGRARPVNNASPLTLPVAYIWLVMMNNGRDSNVVYFGLSRSVL